MNRFGSAKTRQVLPACVTHVIDQLMRYGYLWPKETPSGLSRARGRGGEGAAPRAIRATAAAPQNLMFMSRRRGDAKDTSV